MPPEASSPIICPSMSKPLHIFLVELGVLPKLLDVGFDQSVGWGFIGIYSYEKSIESISASIALEASILETLSSWATTCFFTQ